MIQGPNFHGFITLYSTDWYRTPILGSQKNPIKAGLVGDGAPQMGLELLQAPAAVACYPPVINGGLNGKII